MAPAGGENLPQENALLEAPRVGRGTERQRVLSAAREQNLRAPAPHPSPHLAHLWPLCPSLPLSSPSLNSASRANTLQTRIVEGMVGGGKCLSSKWVGRELFLKGAQDLLGGQ